MTDQRAAQTPDSLRRSPLDDRHRALGARMLRFAGWDMPLDYGSVVAEHRAVRTAAGVFDLSHLGTVGVTGDGAAACLRRALSNDVDALEVGGAQYSLCLSPDGGIVDDLLVYRTAAGYLAVPNAANTDAVAAVLRDCAAEDASVADLGERLAVVAVQGPHAPTVATAAGVDVDGLAYLRCRELPAPPARRGGMADGLLARSGYTGERGYELFVPVADAPTLWDRLVEAGAAPAGLGARDTLRLEMGYPLHGSDISLSTSPVEARLGWAVRAGGGFRGEQAYRRARAAQPGRMLWGLRADGRGIPRAGCAVRVDGRPVGEVTSGTFSPTLRVGIALAYLAAGVRQGARVEVDVRGRGLAAEVVRPPFVDADPRA